MRLLIALTLCTAGCAESARFVDDSSAPELEPEIRDGFEWDEPCLPYTEIQDLEIMRLDAHDVFLRWDTLPASRVRLVYECGAGAAGDIRDPLYLETHSVYVSGCYHGIRGTITAVSECGERDRHSFSRAW